MPLAMATIATCLSVSRCSSGASSALWWDSVTKSASERATVSTIASAYSVLIPEVVSRLMAAWVSRVTVMTWFYPIGRTASRFPWPTLTMPVVPLTRPAGLQAPPAEEQSCRAPEHLAFRKLAGHLSF